MKLSSQQVRANKCCLPTIKFHDANLTSFAGIILFQALFKKLQIKEKISKCFEHLQFSPSYPLARIFQILMVHVLLGFRRLRELAYYKDDPMVLRTVGLKRMPEISTITRSLNHLDDRSYESVRALGRELVLDRVVTTGFPTLTVDFDGSVLWTRSRNTEGTAVGYNTKRRGARGYYPLFATLAQTGQVFDLEHRPGNIHDTYRAKEFIQQVFDQLRSALPAVKLEARFDAAHFSESNCFWLQNNGIEFTISVPFHCFGELKNMVVDRKKWCRIDETWSYFENHWKPKRWDKTLRFLFYRQKTVKPRQGAIQLDLYIPQDPCFEFKVVVTNKNTSARNVLLFHNGRGYQEGIIGELKSQVQMDYLPTRKLLANKMFTLAAIFAHNLNRELHMSAYPPSSISTQARSPRWTFIHARTIRHLILQRAGYLSKPHGHLSLTLSANIAVAKKIRLLLRKLGVAA